MAKWQQGKPPFRSRPSKLGLRKAFLSKKLRTHGIRGGKTCGGVAVFTSLGLAGLIPFGHGSSRRPWRAVAGRVEGAGQRALGKVADLERMVVAQREEIACLKGLKDRPAIKPSGMGQATEPKPSRHRRGRGKVIARLAVEKRVLLATVPLGSRFQGYQDFLV